MVSAHVEHIKTRLILGACLVSMLLMGALMVACESSPRVDIPSSITKPENVRIREAAMLAQQAQRAAEKGKLDEALSLYERSIAEYREFPASWNNLGVLLMEQERYAEAKQAFETAAQLNLYDPRPAYNMGLLYDRRRYMQTAREHYAKALQRDESYLPALRGLIRADKILGTGTDETLHYIEQALLRETDDRWRQLMKRFRLRIESGEETRAP